MLKESGKVVAVDPDGLWIETLRQSACNSCSASKGCGQKLLAKSTSLATHTHIKAEFTDESRDHNWQVGDTAELGMDEQAFLTGALLSYILPLILMIFFSWLGSEINFESRSGGNGFYSEVAAFLGAVLGLAIGGFGVKHHSTRSKQNPLYTPVVLSRLLSCQEIIAVSDTSSLSH
ncbi:MAG: transcriptional regulator [Alteromonadaceae bacterium]|nr:MAG: transcriptional regulator [Alteromonadaceae bacterium]